MYEATLKQQTKSHSPILTTADLALGKRLYPHEHAVERNDHDANDPENLRIVRLVIAEDDGEDDTTKVTSRANDTGEDAISVRVDVRYEREVRTITRLKEYGHDRNEADHLAEVVGVHLSNDDAHYTRHNADEVDPELLCPEVATGNLVDKVRNEATERSGNNVQEAEHSCPASRLCLTKGLEVLEVISTKDRVDSEFTTEGAEVARAEHQCLEREHDLQSLFQSRLDYDFVLEFVHDLNITTSSLYVSGRLLSLLFVVGGNRSSGRRLVIEGTGRGDHGSLVGLIAARHHGCPTLRPLSGGRIVGQQQETGSACTDHDEWNDEGDSPCDVRGETLVPLQRVVDSGHDEVCDTAARVTPASDQSVGSADNIPVVESSCPDLAWYEGAAENTNKETDEV